MLILRIYISVSPSVMAVVRFYSSEVVNGRALQRAAKLYPQLSIASELCYNVELTGECETACQMKMQEVVDSEEIVTTERHINSPCEDFPTHLLFFFYTLSLFLSALCCRLRESRRRAEGGSPLVVSASSAGRAAV